MAGSLCFLFLLTQTFPLHAGESPALPLTHAKIYQKGIDVSRYWISEKLDGVRAYWDGRRLLSRQGHVYPAPEWFTAGFPTDPLDGELWITRNSFEQLLGIVRKKTPVEAGWKRVRYWVFDLPLAGGTFTERLSKLRRLFEKLDDPYLQLVPQYRLADHTKLLQKLEEITNAGGEGLMLHLDQAKYRAGRTDDLLKLKLYYDAEARVIAHLPGKGKYSGMLGALLVETPDGKRFRIGSGFSDKERSSPPPIGSLITYKYYGETRNGIPRFASFLRVREY